MKISVRFFLLFVIAPTFLFQGCSEEKEDDLKTESGFFMVSEEKLELEEGSMIYIEENRGSESEASNYIIDIILYSDGIEVLPAENGMVNFNGSGQKIWFALATSSKTTLDEGVFSLNGENFQMGGYCTDWLDERDATDENVWNHFNTGELSISVVDDFFSITFNATDEQDQEITGQYSGKLHYRTLE